MTKNPQEYADAKSQPHVQVALRMRQAGISVKSGDTIPYVICQVDGVVSGTKQGFADRAYHPDDVVRNEMQLDIDWYLNQQVHPPIGRLCSPIDGTDIARLAECLGLDSTKFNVGRTYIEENDEEFTTLESQISDTERFKDAERLVLQCGFCKHEQSFEGIARILDDNNTVVSGLQCDNCQRMIGETTIRSALIRAMRHFIRQYYQGWLVCDDNTCDSRTRSMSVFGRRCLKENCHGAMKREVKKISIFSCVCVCVCLWLIETIRVNLLKEPCFIIYSIPTSNYIHNSYTLQPSLIHLKPNKTPKVHHYQVLYKTQKYTISSIKWLGLIIFFFINIIIIVFHYSIH